MKTTTFSNLTVSEEYYNLLPKLLEKSFETLRQSIKEKGLFYPIVVNSRGLILDGYHRFKACKELDRKPEFIIRDFEGKLLEKEFVIEANLKRRHLTIWQKIELGKVLLEIEQEKAKQRMSDAGKIGRDKQLGVGSIEHPPSEGKARDIVADKVGLSGTTLQRGLWLLDNAPKEEIEKAKQEDIAISRLYKKQKREKKIKKLQEQAQVLEPPTGKYNIIVVDPPWQYGTKYDPETRRVASPYPEMSLEEIIKEPIPDRTDENCVLWLWTTNAFIHDAFHILERWGFEPKTILTWVKNRFGLGNWLRGQTEHCILAVKGKPVVNLTNQSTVLFADVKRHSEKPDEFYEFVDSLCFGKKLDYFSRKNREGWDTFGTSENNS